MKPVAVAVFPGGKFIPPKEISDYDLQMAHSGLLILSPEANHSVYRELRKWRGVHDPDAI